MGKHDPVFFVQWSPGSICVRMLCNDCGEQGAHFHLPIEEQKEKLH